MDQVVWQIAECHRHGFEILGVLGANRSPNCSVETTSDCGRERPGMGLFMEELHRRLEAHHLRVPMAGLKASDGIPEKLHPFLSEPDERVTPAGASSESAQRR